MRTKRLESEKSISRRMVHISMSGEHFNIMEPYLKVRMEQQKADALLSLYNHKTRNLRLTKVFGDNRVRAGSMLVVNLNLGDVSLQNFMLVETCKHTYKENEHWMDITLRGGEFIA